MPPGTPRGALRLEQEPEAADGNGRPAAPIAARYNAFSTRLQWRSPSTNDRSSTTPWYSGVNRIDDLQHVAYWLSGKNTPENRNSGIIAMFT